LRWLGAEQVLRCQWQGSKSLCRNYECRPCGTPIVRLLLPGTGRAGLSHAAAARLGNAGRASLHLSNLLAQDHLQDGRVNILGVGEFSLFI